MIQLDSPDVLGAITSARTILDDQLHCAVGISPQSAVLNQPIELLIVLQSAIDSEIDLSIKAHVPLKDHHGNDLKFHLPSASYHKTLEPLEVGVVHLPIYVQEPTPKNASYDIIVAFEFAPKPDAKVMRPTSVGRPPIFLSVSPIYLHVLRDVHFTADVHKPNQLKTTLNIVAESFPLESEVAQAQYVSLWTTRVLDELLQAFEEVKQETMPLFSPATAPDTLVGVRKRIALASERFGAFYTRIITLVLGKAIPKELGQQLSNNAIGVFFVKIAATFVALASGVALTRTLGATSYGYYANALAWVMLLRIVAAMGLEKLLVRNTPVYIEQGNFDLLRGFLSWSTRLVIISSILIAGLVSVGAALLSNWDQEMVVTMWVAMATLPIFTVNVARFATIRGLKKVAFGEVVDVLTPLLLLTFLMTFVFVKGDISGPEAMILRSIAMVITMSLGIYVLSRLLPKELATATSQYDVKAWRTSMLPLLLIGGMMVIQQRTDVIMLGILSAPDEVAFYAVASRGAMLMGFFFTALTSVLSPVIAVLHIANRQDLMQQIVTNGTRLSFGLTLITSIILVVFRQPLLGIFGEEYRQAHIVLVLLVGYHLIGMIAGPVNTMLVYTNHEKQVLWVTLISVILNIVLNATFIPMFGAEGAALSILISYLAWNTILVVRTYQFTGIDPTIFGLFSRKKHVAVREQAL